MLNKQLYYPPFLICGIDGFVKWKELLIFVWYLYMMYVYGQEEILRNGQDECAYQ